MKEITHLSELEKQSIEALSMPIENIKSVRGSNEIAPKKKRKKKLPKTHRKK